MGVIHRSEPGKRSGRVHSTVNPLKQFKSRVNFLLAECTDIVSPGSKFEQAQQILKGAQRLNAVGDREKLADYRNMTVAEKKAYQLALQARDLLGAAEKQLSFCRETRMLLDIKPEDIDKVLLSVEVVTRFATNVLKLLEDMYAALKAANKKSGMPRLRSDLGYDLDRMEKLWSQYESKMPGSRPDILSPMAFRINFNQVKSW